MRYIDQYFKGKKEVKPEDIELFVSRKIEENMNLDYKDIRAYQDADDLAIHVSSFANSEGGLIVLGVSQNEIKDENGKTIKIYPNKVTWGKVSLDKESLEHRLMSRIRPPIDGLIIRPIRNEEDKVIFLIDIPKSNLAPHMVGHKYHRRTNFGTRAMEHYEVANLFRINWTMKDKLVERIYEPLCSILEKHTEELAKYCCPYSHEVEEILSITYYKMQMPSELLERLDYYVNSISDLFKKEYFARKALGNIVKKNVLEYLTKEDYTSKDKQRLDFTLISEESHTSLDIQELYQVLLGNQKIQPYLKKVHYQQVYEKLQITYSHDMFTVSLDEFDKHIWKECLKEVSESAEIIQMKKSTDALLERAWDLIEEITRY